MEKQEAYKQAKKKAEAKRDFYIHLLVYIVINTLLIVINLVTSSQYLWFKWPLMGWGLGLVLDGLRVFTFNTMIEKKVDAV